MVTRQDVADRLKVSKRTIVRLFTPFELAGRLTPVEDSGRGHEISYQDDQVWPLVEELEAAREVLRNSRRAKARAPAWMPNQ